MAHNRIMLPSLYVPHGGGPCFFMDDPERHWFHMGQFLRELPASLPEVPRAILIVSGHWETRGFAVTAAERPTLIFDYYGFPPHTYQLRYDAPGYPVLAARVQQLLSAAGFEAGLDPARGLDHGVFIPLKVTYPEADTEHPRVFGETGDLVQCRLELAARGQSRHLVRVQGDSPEDRRVCVDRLDRVARAGQVAADLHDPVHPDGRCLAQRPRQVGSRLVATSHVEVGVVVDDGQRQRVGWGWAVAVAHRSTVRLRTDPTRRAPRPRRAW